MTTVDRIDVVALTIRAEARNQRIEGRVAVGCVIRNRVEADLGRDGKPDWWGEGYIEVCRKPKQFSCWNDGVDPNHRELMAMLDRIQRGQFIADTSYWECRWIAQGIIGGQIGDRVSGATHYCRVDLKPMPAWTTQARMVDRIDDHAFFDAVP